MERQRERRVIKLKKSESEENFDWEWRKTYALKKVKAIKLWQRLGDDFEKRNRKWEWGNLLQMVGQD